jgi:hypothetical protein
VAHLDPHEPELRRRSIAMRPPGHSAGALTREAIMDVAQEVATARLETARYRQAVDELRYVLEAFHT